MVGFTSLISGILLSVGDKNSLVFYGDAAAHLVRARQLVDSTFSVEDTLGTVWLPLGHILLSPFVCIDALFYSGTAGMCLGIPFLVGTAWFLYDLTFRLSHSVLAAAVAACALGLNPNIVYLVNTPMSEAGLLFFFTGASYAFYRWTENPLRFRWLYGSATLAACATLCRYEAWMLPPALTLLAFVNILGQRRIAYLQSRRPWLAFIAAFAGIILWFLWNWYYYGDALRFLGDTYLAGSEPARAHLHKEPWEVISLYSVAAVEVFGPVLLGLVCFGGWIFVKKRQGGLLVILLLPALFTIVAMFLGFVQMDQWGWNVRYVTILAPVCSIAAGLSIDHMAKRSSLWSKILLGGIFVTFLVQLLLPIPGVITYKDAIRQFYPNQVWAADTGTNLSRRYDGGGIMLFTGHGQGVRIMIPSEIHLRDFSVISDPADSSIIAEPWRFCRYLVLALHPTPEANFYTDRWLSNMQGLLSHYRICHENPEFIILRNDL